MKALFSIVAVFLMHFCNAQDTIPDTLAVLKEGSDSIYTKVEEMPHFAGEETAFQLFLRDQIRYPQMEREKGHEGTVYICFTVLSSGEITNVFCKKGVDGAPGLDKEGVRVIKAMPDWEPGRHEGKAVPVEMVIPIRFRLH